MNVNNTILEITDPQNTNLNYRLQIHRNGDSIRLQGNFLGKDIYLEALRIDLKKLPISRDNFHWMVN
jgi:hypothetical protein